jgi:hypothetical protein
MGFLIPDRDEMYFEWMSKNPFGFVVNIKTQTLHRTNCPQDSLLIRDYLYAIENKARASSLLTDDLIAWLALARKKADWFDPLVDGEDELLKGIKKDNF